MSEQYGRQWQLVVADDNDTGIDLSPLKIQFKVRQGDIQTPNNAFVRIYNLSEATRNLLLQGEFTRMLLQAGYQNGVNFGTVFKGSIMYSARGRENPTDVYVDLLGSDGDAAYNFSVVGQTLAAGSLPGDHVQAALAAMAPYGITEGYINQLGTTALARGKVLYGMSRDVLRTVTRTYGVSWSIVNGQLQLVALNSYLPGEAVVLNSATGLIGMPRLEPDGIHVRCLLNPNVKVGGLIQLNNADIVGYLGSAVYSYNPSLLPEINDDGVYKTYVVEHEGDTRGQPWYTDIICLSNAANTVTPVALIPRLAASN